MIMGLKNDLSPHLFLICLRGNESQHYAESVSEFLCLVLKILLLKLHFQYNMKLKLPGVIP